MDIKEFQKVAVGDDWNTFLYSIMRPDRTFESDEEELKFLRTALPILRDEIMNSFSFIEEKGMLNQYFSQRNNFC